MVIFALKNGTSSRTNRQRNAQVRHARKGAIVPLFGLLLPVLLVFCGFAINLAYMQVVTTELKIATDCAAHAGGRAMSIAQDDDSLTVRQKRDLAISEGIAKAREIAALNTVLGRQLSVGDENSDSEVQVGFGSSIRANNGRGMYEYTEFAFEDVAEGDARPSSLHVDTNMNIPFIFRVMNNKATANGPARNITGFSPTRRSVATQVNRDIALVLDRSGSMLRFGDEELLADTLDDLYGTVRIFDRYRLSFNRRSRFYNETSWIERGQPVPSNFNGPIEAEYRRLISDDERDDGQDNLNRRRFTDNVIYQLERLNNPNHTVGLKYSENVQNNRVDGDYYDPDDDQRANGDQDDLTQPMAIYARDWDNAYLPEDVKFPRFSRWALLVKGVDAFLDVLEQTDQEELVSLVTFSTSARLDFNLQDSTDDDGQQPHIAKGYANIRRLIADIECGGSTAIGDGLLEGLPPLIPNEDDPTSRARPFAARSIVVLTDGDNNRGTNPREAVESIVGENDVTIHTVTFTEGADQSAMQDVADAGHGHHYHDNDGSMLVAIFEEIANNLPTILTE